jgi:hypothetical protein
LLAAEPQLQLCVATQARQQAGVCDILLGAPDLLAPLRVILPRY